ncbi:MAG: DUF1700 domain-containing protein [Oscillospiraceae bacterium]|nr:DUF1700 domain-containing protein [Oscillospiraceae bacterium]
MITWKGMMTMTRREYLTELDLNLITLPDEEREMAVNFYREYFDEAGGDNEAAVMAELGKPFQLAKSIISEQSDFSKSAGYIKYRQSKPLNHSAEAYVSLKKDSIPYNPQSFQGAQAFRGVAEQDASPYGKHKEESYNQPDNTPDIMPSGHYAQQTSEGYERHESYQEPSPRQSEPYRNPYNAHGNPFTAHGNPFANKEYGKKRKGFMNVILWIVFILFVGLPIILPIAIALFAMILSLGIAAGAMVVSGPAAFLFGIVLAFIGAAQIFTNSLADGVAMVGYGFITSGAGVLIFIPGLLFFAKFVPWCVKKHKNRNKGGGI